jgi:G3E family GTPase
MSSSGESAVPFTILTGWLGAGKTTVLNRMLSARHGKRIAVLVNELGRIAIDTKLILSRGSDVLELAGGCVCCKVDTKNDLWDGIGDVIARSAPDFVVLETTGIAEPAAILDGMGRVPESVRHRVSPAGIICVVDGEAGADALRKRDEARQQVQCADRVYISKLDLAQHADVLATHQQIDALAPHAERASFASDEEGGVALTNWVLQTRPLLLGADGSELLHPHDQRHHHDHGAHHHRGQLAAASFVDDQPLLADLVMQVLVALGERLYRAKGFVRIADLPSASIRMAFIEHAGRRTTLTMLPPTTEMSRSELVVIGEGIDDNALRRSLWACRAGGALHDKLAQ